MSLCQSASSWGCELKWKRNDTEGARLCQPLREAVSWNIMSLYLLSYSQRQPLREAVSWNPDAVVVILPAAVSLFVRLWVEMCLVSPSYHLHSSASSWGCELKCVHHHSRKAGYCQPLREAVSWNNGGKIQYVRYPMSASSWGCELKYPGSVLGELEAGQPLRKAVSWNKKHDNYYVAGPVVSLFVRLWVEIWHATPYTLRQDRQPLREAVSWNTTNLTAINSK